MAQKTRQGIKGPKHRGTKTPIVSDLTSLEEKPRKSGYQLVAHLIGVAVLAAHDESRQRSTIAST